MARIWGVLRKNRINGRRLGRKKVTFTDDNSGDISTITRMSREGFLIADINENTEYGVSVEHYEVLEYVVDGDSKGGDVKFEINRATAWINIVVR